MAKATVTKICPTCGREFTWPNTCYNRREANRWEEWAEGQERECCECYAETMRRNREAEAAATLKEAKNNPFGIDIDALPLPGTEKQTAWARKIAAEFVVDLAKHKPTAEGIKFIADALRNATARELIDNRSHAVCWLEAAIQAAQGTSYARSNNQLG